MDKLYGTNPAYIGFLDFTSVTKDGKSLSPAKCADELNKLHEEIEQLNKRIEELEDALAVVVDADFDWSHHYDNVGDSLAVIERFTLVHARRVLGEGGN